MDESSSHSDDLSNLEACLAALRPSSEGLTPDAMLFAAGRASAGRNKAGPLWPIISAGLAMVIVALIVQLGTERSERIALLDQLRHQTSDSLPIAPLIADETAPVKPLESDSYLAMSREWYQHPDEVSNPMTPHAPSTKPRTSDGHILRAWPVDGSLEAL
jgi:hypothetical protein